MTDNKGQTCIINYQTIFPSGESEEIDSFSSEKVEPSFTISTNPIIQEKKRTIVATSIIRTYYTNKIIYTLDWLTENHNSSMDSLPYIQELFRNLNEYKEQYFEDPFSSFISALYDGLVFDNKWIDISKENYKKITKIIKLLNNNKNLDYNKIDKSINELEKMGIDTTPY